MGTHAADRDASRQIIKSARSEGLFTPPSLEGTIVFPGNAGGMNWSGMSYDPRRGLLITNTNRIATLVKLIPREEYTKLRASGAGSRFKGEFGRQNGNSLRDVSRAFARSERRSLQSAAVGCADRVDLRRARFDGTFRWARFRN